MSREASETIMLVLIASAFQTLAIWLAAWVIVAFRRTNEGPKR